MLFRQHNWVPVKFSITVHEIPENIVDSSLYGAEHRTWWRSGHTGSTKWSKVQLEAITPPQPIPPARDTIKTITMSLCISRDTDSLECTVYLPMRKKGAKGTSQKRREGRGVEKEKKKKHMKSWWHSSLWCYNEGILKPSPKWTSVHMFAWGHTQMDDSREVSRGWEDPTWETAGLAEQWPIHTSPKIISQMVTNTLGDCRETQFPLKRQQSQTKALL